MIWSTHWPPRGEGWFGSSLQVLGGVTRKPGEWVQ